MVCEKCEKKGKLGKVSEFHFLFWFHHFSIDLIFFLLHIRGDDFVFTSGVNNAPNYMF